MTHGLICEAETDTHPLRTGLWLLRRGRKDRVWPSRSNYFVKIAALAIVRSLMTITKQVRNSTASSLHCCVVSLSKLLEIIYIQSSYSSLAEQVIYISSLFN